MIFKSEIGGLPVEVECGFDDPVDEVYIESVAPIFDNRCELVFNLNDSTIAELLIQAKKVLSERKLEAQLNLVE